MLLGLDGEGLAEPTRLFRHATLWMILTENEAELFGVGFLVWSIIGVDTDLVVIVISLLVTLVQLIGHRDLPCHARVLAYWLIKKDTRC